MAFWPGIETLHLVLPAITCLLILLNLGLALRSLWRGVPVTQLLMISALQIGLFTVLFFQFAAHLGAEHYELHGAASPWLWLGFSLAHAARAADVLDTIEAYGLTIQTIKHKSWFVATFVVLFHVVVDTFVLCLLQDGFQSVQTLVSAARANAARWILNILITSFTVWVGIWLGCALWFRPWNPIDIPLWLLDNVLRVVDFADAIDSYNISFHQIPKGFIENTLTFFCRVWVALGIGFLLTQWRKPSPDGWPPTGAGHAPRRELAVAVALFVAVVSLGQVLAAQTANPLPELTRVACGQNEQAAEQALRALRRMGPAAAPAIPKLVARIPQVSLSSRLRLVETLGYLGEDAIVPLTTLATGFGEALALAAVQALEPNGVRAAPGLMQIWRESKFDAVRQSADAGLRHLGAGAVPPLMAAAAPRNLEDCYFWFRQLDRNWTLHQTNNPHAQLLLELADILDRLPNVTDPKTFLDKAKKLVAHGPAAKGSHPERGSNVLMIPTP